MQVTTTYTSSYSYTTGKSFSETKEVTASPKVTVKPRSSKVATLASKRYKMDVPYTAEIQPTYTDGTRGAPYIYNGVYEGVQVHDITMTFDEDVPLS